MAAGAAAPNAARFLSGTTATRPTGATTWASAFVATPTNVGYTCMEIIKAGGIHRRAVPLSNTLRGSEGTAKEASGSEYSGTAWGKSDKL